MEKLSGLTDEQIAALQKSRQRVIESIGKNMELYGVTLSVGHLYGHMLFKHEPVTLDEMAQTLGLSKTSISTGMRTLMDLKMINKVWSKGTRKDLYEVEMDWHQTFADYFVIKWRKGMEKNLQAVKKSRSEMLQMLEDNKDNQALADIVSKDIEKLNEAIKYYHWLGKLIDAFESGEIFEFIPKETAES